MKTESTFESHARSMVFFILYIVSAQVLREVHRVFCMPEQNHRITGDGRVKKKRAGFLWIIFGLFLFLYTGSAGKAAAEEELSMNEEASVIVEATERSEEEVVQEIESETEAELILEEEILILEGENVPESEPLSEVWEPEADVEDVLEITAEDFALPQEWDIDFYIFLNEQRVMLQDDVLSFVRRWEEAEKVFSGISLDDLAQVYGAFGFTLPNEEAAPDLEGKFVFAVRGQDEICDGAICTDPESGKMYVSHSKTSDKADVPVDIYYLPKGNGGCTSLDMLEENKENSFYSVEVREEGEEQIHYVLRGSTIEITVPNHDPAWSKQTGRTDWICLGADGTTVSGNKETKNCTTFAITDIFQPYLIERADQKGLPIIFENGIHYITDPEYPDEKITLFCMNNKLHWPHHTDDMGEMQMPDYTEGYLTPKDFDSPEDYAECMRRLSKLLYAGYPYNGERLYKIVESTELYIPTEAQFNEMLIVPPALQKAFPYLGHHAFSYQDWAGNDEEHIKELTDFIGAVAGLYPNGQTETGLTFSDITAMPFYKATISMLNATNHDDPLHVFAYFYSDSYFVTEEQAYNATQKAVWMLLNAYHIPDNDISNLNDTKLGEILYTYSERGGLLDHAPSRNEIHLSGSLKFSYNPKDGLWHSGVLQVIEPSEYHGIYYLELPKGMTALCDNLSYVYGNEEYELVSDHEPAEEETFGIRAEFIWLKEFKQYSPTPDLEVNGKKFQHMIGAVIRTAEISENVPVGVNKVGSLSVTKQVVGETNCQERFEFELKLPFHTNLNGLYGDMEFHNGVAKFSLQDNETKTAENLPEGAWYEVTEYETKQYQMEMVNKAGEIVKDSEISVICKNTKCPDLSLRKIVTGEAGDKTKTFTFSIQLTDKNGIPVNGDYTYKGSIKKGFEQEASAPFDGVLRFVNGLAEISLSHGQQITLLDLPPETHYKIEEKEANQDHYTTAYNGTAKSAEGVLKDDTVVEVENNKEFVPDTGITGTNQTGIGIGIVLSLSAVLLPLWEGVFLWRRRRKK